jgi:hypothetical protein
VVKAGRFNDDDKARELEDEGNVNDTKLVSLVLMLRRCHGG